MVTCVLFILAIYNSNNNKKKQKFNKLLKFILFKMNFFHKKKILNYSILLLNVLINKKMLFYYKLLQVYRINI